MNVSREVQNVSVAILIATVGWAILLSLFFDNKNLSLYFNLGFIIVMLTLIDAAIYKWHAKNLDFKTLLLRTCEAPAVITIIFIFGTLAILVSTFTNLDFYRNAISFIKRVTNRT